jgi:hypothetical protein
VREEDSGVAAEAIEKPSTQREINDLLRQIEDKKKVLKYRSEAIHT